MNGVGTFNYCDKYYAQFTQFMELKMEYIIFHFSLMFYLLPNKEKNICRIIEKNKNILSDDDVGKWLVHIF